jgi:hypothetical protein
MQRIAVRVLIVRRSRYAHLHHARLAALRLPKRHTRRVVRRHIQINVCHTLRRAPRLDCIHQRLAHARAAMRRHDKYISDQAAALHLKHRRRYNIINMRDRIAHKLRPIRSA